MFQSLAFNQWLSYISWVVSHSNRKLEKSLSYQDIFPLTYFTNVIFFACVSISWFIYSLKNGKVGYFAQFSRYLFQKFADIFSQISWNKIEVFCRPFSQNVFFTCVSVSWFIQIAHFFTWLSCRLLVFFSLSSSLVKTPLENKN